MKNQIRISGWNTGLRKVSLTKLIVEYSNISLSKAKEVTDNVLDNIQVVVLVDDDLTEEFIERATEIGAICEKMNS